MTSLIPPTLTSAQLKTPIPASDGESKITAHFKKAPAAINASDAAKEKITALFQLSKQMPKKAGGKPLRWMTGKNISAKKTIMKGLSAKSTPR